MKRITTSELKTLLDKNENVTLINTLGAVSFGKTKIPGAINVPLNDDDFPLNDDDFVARVEKQASGKDKPVVVYCASQRCNSSEQAAEKLENAGFSAITDYAGGYKAWQEEAAEVAECHSC